MSLLPLNLSAPLLAADAAAYVQTLSYTFSQCIPEAILVGAACFLYVGGTWKANRTFWGVVALIAILAAALVVGFTKPLGTASRDSLFLTPLVHDHLAVLFRWLALAGGAVLILLSWDEVGDEQAADYHACLLVVTAGVSLVGSANELVTLFLALEMVSIPTYILLYLPRTDQRAQESAMKYFLLSVFSSAMLLFGMSYLYGLAGTTNIPAITQALAAGRSAEGGHLPGVALLALVMIVAGLGFRITAVPFHFYAPDVYQGTTMSGAAFLSFVPKVIGFAALIRVLAYVTDLPRTPGLQPGLVLGDQGPLLFYIMAVVTMSLGNVLALLQDNLRRLMAYSSVANAGYMLIGLVVAPKLGRDASAVGGIDAILFYLIAYGAMTLGAFAVFSYLNNRGRPTETVHDLAGLGRSHPFVALALGLFLFSLIGIPLTAGFLGKFYLFFGAMGVPYTTDQYWLFVLLSVIGMLNAAIGGWYYLRITTIMYLQDDPEHLGSDRPAPKLPARPILAAIVACAVVTLVGGIYPAPIVSAVRQAVARPGNTAAVPSGPQPVAVTADVER